MRDCFAHPISNNQLPPPSDIAELSAHKILTGSAFNKTVEVSSLSNDGIAITWDVNGVVYTYSDE